VKDILSTFFYLLSHQSNPRFGGGSFSYEAGVNLPKAIIEWVKGNPVDTSMLVPRYGRMFAKNDCLVEVGV
jgi:carbamoyl-phosphate synthase large subunit